MAERDGGHTVDGEIDWLVEWAITDIVRRHGAHGVPEDALADVVFNGCAAVLGEPTLSGDDRSLAVALLPMHDERLACWALERRRWGGGVRCPRCGVTQVTAMRSRSGGRNERFLWMCRGCARQFTVRVGTPLSDSPLPLRHWCYAVWAAHTSLVGGVTAAQLRDALGIAYTSALFVVARLPEVLARPDVEVTTDGTSRPHTPHRTAVGARLRLLA